MIDHQVPVANAHVERENSLQKNLLEEFNLNFYLDTVFYLFSVNLYYRKNCDSQNRNQTTIL